MNFAYFGLSCHRLADESNRMKIGGINLGTLEEKEKKYTPAKSRDSDDIQNQGLKAGIAGADVINAAEIKKTAEPAKIPTGQMF